MLKMEDITKLTDKEVVAKVSELKRELFNLRMQKGVAGIEKPHRIKEAKKDIARLNTAVTAKGKR